MSWAAGHRWGDPPSDQAFAEAFNKLNKRTYASADAFWKALCAEFPEWTGKEKPDSDNPYQVSLTTVRGHATKLSLKRKR